MPVPIISLFLQSDKEEGLSGDRVLTGAFAGPDRSKGTVDGITVIEIGGLINSVTGQILQGNVDFSGILVYRGGYHFHTDSLIFRNHPDRHKVLGRPGGQQIQELIDRFHMGSKYRYGDI